MAGDAGPAGVAAVSFAHVGYDVGGRRILDDIQLDVMPGETLVLLGRSGSGKTTALRLVNAMLRPTRGEVYVQGRATTAWDVIRLRRSIGYVIQEAGLFPHFTIGQNVALVPRLEQRPEPEVDARVRELLGQVGLPPDEFAARYPRQLSGGQRQRVGIARALAANPPLLLMDEPFGALDPVTRKEAQDLLLHLRQRFGKTALFVTHDVREALRLASRIALFHEGRLVAAVPPDEFHRLDHPEARAFQAALQDV